MLPLSTLTELEATNIMLSTIGESPITDLALGATSVDVAMASSILREVTIQVLETGWQYNTEKLVTLTPHPSTQEIAIPTDCIQIDTAGPDASLDVAQRGSRLYNRAERTYAFTKPVQVDMVILMDFSEQPQAARHYITVRAARIFQQRILGSDTLNGYTSRDEARALATLVKMDANNADYNILSGSWSVSRILAR